jgi:hypothetical protein
MRVHNLDISFTHEERDICNISYLSRIQNGQIRRKLDGIHHVSKEMSEI